MGRRTINRPDEVKVVWCVCSGLEDVVDDFVEDGDGTCDEWMYEAARQEVLMPWSINIPMEQSIRIDSPVTPEMTRG